MGLLYGESCMILTATVLSDRTATQYDGLLASSCCPSVCLSLALCIVALRVGLRAKRCSNVFLFVPSDTFAVGCIF